MKAADLNPKRMPRVVMIEDNPADAALFRNALFTRDEDIDFIVFETGGEGSKYADQLLTSDAKEMPSLIVMDMNIPVMSGLELTDKIKQTPNLRSIPVVIFTTSDNASDIDKANQVRANAYVIKPSDHNEFREKVHQIASFWLHTATTINHDE